MLGRVAARSLRLHLNPPSIQAALKVHQPRSYATTNKPKKPIHYQPPSTIPPSDRYGPDAQTAQKATEPERTSPATVVSESIKNIKSSDLAKKQDESDTATTSEDNTIPSSSGARHNIPASRSTEASSHTEYSKLQDEFETSSSSDKNTAPQDSSPSAIDPAEVQRQKERPTPPLHDLTKGIPSTLDSELTDASTKPGAPGLNLTEDPTQTSTGGRGGRELPRSAYISSSERRRNRMANWMYAGFLVFSITGTIYLGRDWETQEEQQKHTTVPSGWGFGLFYNRVKARLADTLDYYNEPAFPKLLPNTDPVWERPYTLVLSLEDLLVHSEWTREHGWRMAKRPGVDYFLRYLSQYYELVIFTSVPSMIADPVIRKLDPYRIIMWPLFREATRYKNGEYIKVGRSKRYNKRRTYQNF